MKENTEYDYRAEKEKYLRKKRREKYLMLFVILLMAITMLVTQHIS